MFTEAQLFTRCSLLVEIHSLLVTCCKITRYLLQNSFVTRCKHSPIARCKIRLLLVVEVARCKKSLVTRRKICSLLVAEVARSKYSHIARCKTRSLLVSEFARCKKSFVAKFDRYLLHKVTKHSHFQLNLVMDDKI